MTWNSSATTLLKSKGVPVKFAQPKEGALTWVCGVMIHKDAPHLDRAYDIVNSLLSVDAGKFMINDYGYGHSNRKSFDAFDDKTLAGLNLSRTPSNILNAGSLPDPAIAGMGDPDERDLRSDQGRLLTQKSHSIEVIQDRPRGQGRIAMATTADCAGAGTADVEKGTISGLPDGFIAAKHFVAICCCHLHWW